MWKSCYCRVMTLQTVDRALRLLELMQLQPVVSLREAAEHLHVGQSVAYRLLATLESRGFVRRSVGGPGYRLGPSMSWISPAGADTDYVTLAMEDLRELQKECGETVHLAVLRGLTVGFIESLVSRHAMRIESRVGEFLPAYLTASGRALLADVPRKILIQMLPEGELPGARDTVTPTTAALLEELDRITTRGYSRNIEETEPGIAALARTIALPSNIPTIAVTVAGAQARLLLDRDNPLTENEISLAGHLHAAVSAIQAKIDRGYPDPESRE